MIQYCNDHLFHVIKNIFTWEMTLKINKLESLQKPGTKSNKNCLLYLCPCLRRSARNIHYTPKNKLQFTQVFSWYTILFGNRAFQISLTRGTWFLHKNNSNMREAHGLWQLMCRTGTEHKLQNNNCVLLLPVWRHYVLKF